MNVPHFHPHQSHLHPIYKEPLIQFSTAGSPAQQVMQITDDTKQMQISNHLHANTDDSDEEKDWQRAD